MNRRSINLLTAKFRFYLLVKARVLQWSAMWVACSFVMVVWWQVENQRLGATMDALAIMESRVAPLQHMQNQNQTLAERLRTASAQSALIL